MASYARDRNLTRVGALVVVAVVVFGALFLWLTDRGLSRHRADLYVELAAADGLKKGDPVLFRGVPVGEVRELDLTPEGGVVVEARLKRRVPLTKDATAVLQTVDVFGGQSVVLQAGSPAAPPLADGDTLTGSVPRSLAATAEVIGERAERLLDDKTIELVHGTLAGGARAATELQRLIADANALLAAQSENLAAATANIVAVTENLEGVTAGPELERAVRNLEETTANLAAMTASMGEASASLASVMAKLDRGEGTAGRLLNDRALYDQVLAATGKLDALAEDIRKNPKRYINVSVF
jgi:phospholipid/cholesterol/gamma-HCH transport system substrate-binding protein